MHIETGKLRGRVLNYVVAMAKADGRDACVARPDLVVRGIVEPLPYTSDWGCAGPLIDEADISIRGMKGMNMWRAFVDVGGSCNSIRHEQSGQTKLEACMRSYVASRHGLVVDIPDEVAKALFEIEK